MDTKKEPVSPQKIRYQLSNAEKDQKLAEITKIVKENQGNITTLQFDNVVSLLFTLVPELETIQKNARIKVWHY